MYASENERLKIKILWFYFLSKKKRTKRNSLAIYGEKVNLIQYNLTKRKLKSKKSRIKTEQFDRN